MNFFNMGLLIKNICKSSLKKLNEGEESKGLKKYKFTGCFTQCSVPGAVVVNRNGRIYQENEVLRHLGYLRDKIKKDGSILGELDHPEGRFDISLKEASHKITDLWYDQQNHRVMGTIELLDTPNGKIAKSLVDSGFPVYVSSRAAGDVDPKTKEVEIATIFTYDIVCTPGFEEARLNQVSESLKSNAKTYLLESVNGYKKEQNLKNMYKILDENVYVKEIDATYTLNENEKEAMKKEYDVKDLVNPLNEEDAQALNDDKEYKDEAAKAGLAFPDMSPIQAKESDKDVNEDDDAPENDGEQSDDSKDDENKESKKDMIVDIKKDEEKSKRDMIVNIEIEQEEDKEDKKEDEKEDDKKEEESKEEDDKDDNVKECGETPKTECVSKDVAEKITKDTEKMEEDVDKLISSINKKAGVKESIINQYPFTISLSPENFARFTQLSEEEKFKCQAFVEGFGIRDIKQINELWSTPTQEKKNDVGNWIKLADKEDIELYLKESAEVQDAIEQSAQFFDFKTKADVDEFWAKTGLRQKKAQKIAQEQLVEKYKDMYNPKTFNSDLGYSSVLAEYMADYMLSQDEN